MWDEISATNTWLNSQIPEIIRTIYTAKSIAEVEEKYQTRISIDEIDFAYIAILYTHILSAALFSIGFKYAGSGNSDVFKFLLHHTEYIINMKVINSKELRPNIAYIYTNSKNKNNIDKTTYEKWLWMAAFALSMVMAGTGDVNWFRVLRRIRKILEKDMHYGFNMAIHMAIGFLFLGAGKYTFSTSNLSIAGLLISLYPWFPEAPNDNRYHLQALRHFYVLAIENRLLQTVDIETGEFASVPLEIDYCNSTADNEENKEEKDVRSVRTPIMLEDIHKIEKICLKDNKYYEMIIEKPSYLPHLGKISYPIFDRASSLVQAEEFGIKSKSKMSVLQPFDVVHDQQVYASWIPKMIYVK
jgi:anaphase-promoting complex subunit 1